jgi:hypothetical protein
MLRRTDDLGQSNTEYALLIVVVLAIFVVLLAASNTHAPAFFGKIWQRLLDAVK